MIKRIDTDGLVREFRRYGRGDQFTRAALEAILEHQDSIDPDTELDVIGICCTYTEYTPEDLISEFSGEPAPTDPDEVDELAEGLYERARDQSWAVQLNNGNYLIQNY